MLLPDESTLEEQGVIRILVDQNVTDIPPSIANSVALTKIHLITILNSLGIKMGMLGNVITFSTVKGGQAKTLTTLTIIGALRRMGYRVCLIDLDPKPDLSMVLNMREASRTIYGALMGQYTLREAMVSVDDGLDFVPACRDLAAFEEAAAKVKGRQNLLKTLVDPIRDQYDFIFIDPTPHIGLLQANLLAAVDNIFIPTEADTLGFNGVCYQLDTVKLAREHSNTNLTVSGIFFVKHNPKKVLARALTKEIKTQFPGMLCNTYIRMDAALPEAVSQGIDIYSYIKNRGSRVRSHRGGQDIERLANEIIARVAIQHAKSKANFDHHALESTQLST